MLLNNAAKILIATFLSAASATAALAQAKNPAPFAPNQEYGTTGIRNAQCGGTGIIMLRNDDERSIITESYQSSTPSILFLYNKKNPHHEKFRNDIIKLFQLHTYKARLIIIDADQCPKLTKNIQDDFKNNNSVPDTLFVHHCMTVKWFESKDDGKDIERFKKRLYPLLTGEPPSPAIQHHGKEHCSLTKS